MRKRLLITILAITILGIVGFWIASSSIYYESLVEHSKDELNTYMNLIEDKDSFSQEKIEQYSRQLDGARITYMTLDGIVLADSSDSSIVGNAHSNRDEVIKAIQENEGYAVRSSETMREDMVYYCRKVNNNLIRIAIPTSSQMKILGSSFGMIVWFLIADIVICFIVALSSVKGILDPVEKITKNIKERESLKGKYPELLPIINTLENNEKIIKKYICEIEQEKMQVIEAETSKNDFIANITHEMNTPLTSIIGFSNLLENNEVEDDVKKKAIRNIKKQSERLANLIACIINFNEIDNDNLPSYEVDLSKSIEDVAESLEPLAKEKKVEISLDVEKNIMVSSRQERINEIIGNLVRNAIKYNKENGKVSISLNKDLVLVVEDTGIGISKEDLPKVFDRFYTVDKSHNGKHGGFGLGLAVVKKICKNSGWTIRCESELGVGTKFYLEFN